MSNNTENKFNLIKNIRFAVISFAINIVLVFISYKFVIHFAGMEALGLWSLLMAWGALIRLGDVGMGNATLHFVAKSNLESNWEEIQRFIDTGFLMNLLAFFILTTIGYLVLDYNLQSIVKEVSSFELAKNLLPILFLGIFLSSMSSVIFGNLQGLHFGYVSSYLTVSGNIIQIIFVILLVPKIGVLGLVWAQVIQYLILIIFGLFIIKQKSKSKNFLPTNFSYKTLKIMLGFSAKAQVGNIANGLFEPLSKILFSQYGDLKTQGLYELAYKTVSLSRNVIVSGVTASLPSITHLINNDKEKALKLYNISKQKASKAIILMMIFIITISPIISIIWIGEFKSDYSIFIFILAIGFILNTFGATAYNLGLATGNMKNNIITTLLSLVFLLILSLLLGLVLNKLGVVISVMISMGTTGILIKYLNEKLLYERVK